MALEKEKFSKIVTLVIDQLEGGYYHPDMMQDGRLKYNSLLASSGETMFGIDRKNGGSINTSSAGQKFWGIIDSAGARKNWKYNFMGGQYAPQLKILVGEMLLPRYNSYAQKYLSTEALDIVNSDEKLIFHFAYAVWNGPGWFQKFANDINAAVKSGIKSPEKLEQVALDSRLKEGLKEGSAPNKLIQQTGQKIETIFESDMLSDAIEVVKKKWWIILIAAGMLIAAGIVWYEFYRK